MLIGVNALTSQTDGSIIIHTSKNSPVSVDNDTKPLATEEPYKTWYEQTWLQIVR